VNAMDFEQTLSDLKTYWPNIKGAGAYDLYILFLEQAINLTRPEDFVQ